MILQQQVSNMESNEDAQFVSEMMKLLEEKAEVIQKHPELLQKMQQFVPPPGLVTPNLLKKERTNWDDILNSLDQSKQPLISSIPPLINVVWGVFLEKKAGKTMLTKAASAVLNMPTQTIAERQTRSHSRN